MNDLPKRVQSIAINKTTNCISNDVTQPSNISCIKEKDKFHQISVEAPKYCHTLGYISCQNKLYHQQARQNSKD